ncbi:MULTISPECIES: hypothetical protein [unclassified Streptomyces]|uniref:hypothetical protein n=1 Tax=unclassified Streptomyces TaxID=2593676 RepID=UPI0022B6C6BC|nr:MULTISPECIES: hypothetical protein [unclassified Streptomyces]MCZ7414234.1 hypothetical protein [Streptomyces sp. WMMC897]MCZ7431252.1 hypothetical protein [Streptomyces sp. WMMC1477]
MSQNEPKPEQPPEPPEPPTPPPAAPPSPAGSDASPPAPGPATPPSAPGPATPPPPGPAVAPAPSGYVPAPPPPASSGGKGKVIGIAAGALALVAAVVVGVLLLTGGEDDTEAGDRKNSADTGGKGDEENEDEPDNPGETDGLEDGPAPDEPKPEDDPADPPADGTPYKLVLPQKVLDEYSLMQDESAFDAEDEDFQEAVEAMRVEGGEGVQGMYSTVDVNDPSAFEDPTALEDLRMLMVFGSWGSVADPEASVDGFFDEMEKQVAADSEADTLVGEPRAVQPAGLDGAVMKCQVMRTEGLDEGAQDVPLCAWADNSTVVVTMPIKMQGSVSVEEGAQIAADLRAEVRVKAG